MGNLVSGSAKRPGNPIDAAEIPIVRDNDAAIGQGARPTERPEKTTASARHNTLKHSLGLQPPLSIVHLYSVLWRSHTFPVQ